jgi:lactoylglutathione lyase
VGYSHGGKNGTGYQTGEELLAEKTNIEGLIELISSKPKNEFPPTTKGLNTFSHVGLVVPDTKQIEARMQEFGVKVLKQVGKMPVPGTAAGELLERAFGVSTYTEEEQKAALDALAVIGFEDFLIVTDPDGNVLEIQDQV